MHVLESETEIHFEKNWFIQELKEICSWRRIREILRNKYIKWFCADL